MSGARTALSPANLIRNGFDWSGKSARLPYILVTLATIGLAMLIPVTLNFSGANTAVFVALTMVFPVWLGHTRRRLRDVGWSGWCMWLAILPVLGLLLSIFLAFKPGDTFDTADDPAYSRLAFAVALACGAFMLSRAFWAPYWIPAGAMKPALLVGDFIVVVPLGAPERGDILVFRQPLNGTEHIHRLIGLPGDTVQMIDGVVHLNNAPLPQAPAASFVEPYAPQGPAGLLPRCAGEVPTGADCVKQRLTETLPNGRQIEVLDIDMSPADNTNEFTISEGEYFFMGDNRDNANDSRFDPAKGGAGLIPRENLAGRAARVLFSSAGEGLLDVWSWRADRFFKRIE